MIFCFQQDDDEEVTINPKHSTPCRHLSESEISQSTPYTPRFEDMSASFQTVPDDDTVPESPQNKVPDCKGCQSYQALPYDTLGRGL